MQRNRGSFIDLSPTQVATLKRRHIAADVEAVEWPGCDADIASSQEVSELRAAIKRSLFEGPGYAVLRVNRREVEDSHEIKVIYWNLFTTLGEPLPQYSTGEMLFEVEASSESPLYSHYSRSNRGGGFHTDGTFLQKTPQVAGLICLRQAQLGGETILIDGRRLCDELKRNDPETLECLQREFYFDCCNQLPGVEFRAKPIISWKGSNLFIQYLRSYIIEGYKKAGLQLDKLAAESLDRFDSLMEREEFQFIYKLNPGEMLIFNNEIILHGRKPFYDDADKGPGRLLIRVYAAPRREN
jgi:alpha-ketoglutarate-dependent taurine dioxygenase